MHLHTEIDETTMPYNWLLVGRARVSEDNYRFIYGSTDLAVINEFDKLGTNWLLDAGKEFKIIVSNEQLLKLVGQKRYIPFYNRENDKMLPIARCLTPNNLKKIG